MSFLGEPIFLLSLGRYIRIKDCSALRYAVDGAMNKMFYDIIGGIRPALHEAHLSINIVV